MADLGLDVSQLRLLADILSQGKSFADLTEDERQAVTLGLNLFGESYDLQSAQDLLTKLPASVVSNLIQSTEGKEQEEGEETTTKPPYEVFLSSDQAFVNSSASSALLARVLDKEQKEIQEKTPPPLKNLSLKKLELLTLSEKIQLAQQAVARLNQAKALLAQNDSLREKTQAALIAQNPKAADPIPTVRLAAAATIEETLTSLEFTLPENQVALIQNKVANVLLVEPDLDPVAVTITVLAQETNITTSETVNVARQIDQANQTVYQSRLPDPNELLYENIKTPPLPVQPIEIHIDEVKAFREIEEITNRLEPDKLFTEAAEALENRTAEAESLFQKTSTNPIFIAAVRTEITDPISPQIVRRLADDYNRLVPPEQRSIIAAFSTAASARVEKTIEPISPTTAAGIKALNIGLGPKQLNELELAQLHAARQRNSQIPPETLREIRALKIVTQHVQKLPLTSELQPATVNRLYSSIQKNPIGRAIHAFTPVSRVFDVALNPKAALTNWAGQQIGKTIGKYLYKEFAERVTNVAARQIAKTFLREGFKQAVSKATQIIAKQVVTKASTFLAQQGIFLAAEGALAGTVVGIPIAAILAAIDIAITIAQIGKSVLDSIAEKIWGSKIGAKDVAAGATMLAGAGAIPIGGGITLAGAAAGMLGATTKAATSAIGTIVISIAVGVFLYITTFTVAPLLTTLVQLESGQGASPLLVGAGGPIPEGCPSGWPVSSGHVTQGPRTTSTHSGAEAIDIGIGLGTPIVATHDGSGVAYNSRLGYGNHVTVTGTCKGIQFTTIYGHMVYTAFSGSKPVKKGEIIGYVDSTGKSSGNHLHYEIKGGVLGSINQFLPKTVTPGCIEYIVCHVDLP